MRSVHIITLSCVASVLVSGAVSSGVWLLAGVNTSIQTYYGTSSPKPTSLSAASLGTGALIALESGVKSTVANLRPAVVSIVIAKDVPVYRRDPYGFFFSPSGDTVTRRIGGGTGFFITKDGLILTNKHVVSTPDARYTIITATGQEYTGKVIALDPTTDMAIVQAQDAQGKNISSEAVATFAPELHTPDVGSFVVAIGNALAEFDNTVTFGIISGLGRTIEANEGGNVSGDSELLSGLIQTDVAINPGNSGGPLANLLGEVVGINTAIASGASGLGFAIPVSAEEITHIVDSVKKTGHITRAYVGVYLSTLTPEAAIALKLPPNVRHGEMVSLSNGIVPNSPADKAGLKG